jgi:deoxyribodipyrimidine photolyase
MVDACIRCVKATGWLNFRMRAMLAHKNHHAE